MQEIRRIRKDGLESITRILSNEDKNLNMYGYYGSKDGWYGGWCRDRFRTRINMHDVETNLNLTFMSINGKFNNVDLSDSFFSDVRFSNMIFDNCILDNVSFIRTEFYKCKMISSDGIEISDLGKLLKKKSDLFYEGDIILTTPDCCIESFEDFQNHINTIKHKCLCFGRIVDTIMTDDHELELYSVKFGNEDRTYNLPSEQMRKIEL